MKWLLVLISIIVLIPIASASNHLTPFGYQFVDNGNVFNMWNSDLDYYFNTSSGLQFTNNFNEYWSRNIFCIGFLNDSGWQDKCNDGSALNTFNWNFETDNLSYVSVQGYRNITLDGKVVQIGLNYSLNASQNDLIIKPSIKDLSDEPILNELRFKWRIQDIAVHQLTDNFGASSGFSINLSQNWNVTKTNLSEKNFYVYHSPFDYWFRVSWIMNNYNLSAISEAGQYNTPITLTLYTKRLVHDQTKSTIFYWIDASCILDFSPTTPQDSQHLINGDDKRSLGFCVAFAGTGCPICLGTCQCLPQERLRVKPQNVISWNTLATRDIVTSSDSLCPNYLSNTYTFNHNNQTNISGQYVNRFFDSDLGACSDLPSPITIERDNIWLNNHTPITNNTSIQIYNDTFIYLNGVNQYVNASRFTNPQLISFLKNNFTIRLWVYFNSTTTTSSIMSQGDNGGTGRNILVNKPAICGTHLGSNLQGFNSCSNTTLDAGQWFHIILTYNGTKIAFYINGTYSNSSVINPNENAQGDILFGISKTIVQPSNMSFDNFAYWNKTMNDRDILNDYNLGRITNPNINLTNLTTWYTFDESNGVTTFDLQNNEQANLTNGALWVNNGTQNIFCNYSYSDADNDAQNLSSPPPLILWFLNKQQLIPLYNNIQFPNTTISDNYACCVKSFDNVFATGTENWSCSNTLNANYSVAEILTIIAVSSYFIICGFYLSRIRKGFTLLAFSLIMFGIFIFTIPLIVSFNFLNSNSILGIYNLLIYGLLFFGLILIGIMLINLIKLAKK